MALILIQHATSGLHTLDTYVTTTGPPSVNKVLQGINPHLVTLLFMSIEGQIRYVEFTRTSPPHFNGDPKFYT